MSILRILYNSPLSRLCLSLQSSKSSLSLKSLSNQNNISSYILASRDCGSHKSLIPDKALPYLSLFHDWKGAYFLFHTIISTPISLYTNLYSLTNTNLSSHEKYIIALRDICKSLIFDTIIYWAAVFTIDRGLKHILPRYNHILWGQNHHPKAKYYNQCLANIISTVISLGIDDILKPIMLNKLVNSCSQSKYGEEWIQGLLYKFSK